MTVRPGSPSWAQVSAAFADAVRDYHVSRGRSASDPSVASTIRTNTELVPQRGDNLLSMLGELSGGAARIEDRRVLEVGCGFGALATYLAVAGRPRHLTAVDNRADFIASATRCTERLGIQDRLTFAVADMRDLSPVGGEPFDVVVLNNAFIYLPTRREMKAALDQLAERTAPGGWLLMYHANRWTPREPFTKDPIVHLLPPPLARPVARLTGWKHNHGRVRLVSPLELRSLVRRAGFEAVRFGSPVKGAFKEGELFGSFYALAGRRRG